MNPLNKLASVSILVLGLAGMGFADDQAPAGPPKAWKNAAEFSAVSTNGNSKGTTTSGKDTFNYSFGRSILELIGGGLGSSNNTGVTAEQYNASQKVTTNFTEKNYIYEKGGWEKNRFAGFQNRFEASTGLGRMLLDFPDDKLNTEVGPGYVNEDRINAPRNEFFSGRAYAKYVHTLSATANFSQDAEYIHDFSDKRDYRLNTETALIASLSTHLSLKVSYTWKRVAKPPVGVSKDDTTTAAALIINY